MDKISIDNSNRDLYLNFYKQMFRIRRAEETVLDLFSRGKLMGTAHTYIGQESCAVGLINALDREKDIIFSNHRGHGHYLTYCGDLVGLFGEIMGRSIGCCGGIGGSQHTQIKNMYTNGIQGGIVPVATGTALAEKQKKSDAISVVFMGDGTFGEGVLYESFNMASLWKLPILYVLENNRYAQTTPFELQHAGKLAERLKPYNIKSAEIDAVDVVKIHELSKELVQYIRSGNGPGFLALNTYRLAPHSKGDDTRKKEEIEHYRQIDPLMRLRISLQECGTVLEPFESEIEQEIQEAVDAASESSPCTWDEYRERFDLDWRVS
jgi:acetoin:2,6-dichlorophenolindophenol oxidoreductase subunit alpha